MTWNELWNNYINLAPGLGQVALRLACAMLVGIIIGLEREYTHRPAGLRTHILVAVGACAVSVTGEMLFTQYHALGAMPDPARLSAQVITGVGFLGAGTIMKEGATVKGLTTAASVWAVACLGIAAGFGYFTLTLLGTVFMFFTLTLVEALQHRFIRVGSSEENYALETNDLSAALNRITAVAQSQQVAVLDMAAVKTEDGHRLSFRVHFSGRRHKKHHARFFEALAIAPEVTSVRVADKTGVGV